MECIDGIPCIEYDENRCPGGTITSDDKKFMSGKPIFYNNGTMKLLFLSPLPERENANKYFETESSDIKTLPARMLINGIHYKGYKPEVGKYLIDRADGLFGSVTFPVQLIK